MNTPKINNPCTEDWNKMTPETKGKFCSKCTKVVQDFRKSTSEEIAKFMTNSQEKNCGRFYKHQLVDIKQQQHWRLFRRFAFAILIAFGSTLFTVNTALAQEKIDTWKSAFSIEKDGVVQKYDYNLKGVAIDAYTKKTVGFAKISYYKKSGLVHVIANEKGEFEFNLNKSDINMMTNVMFSARSEEWYFGSSKVIDLTKGIPDRIEIPMYEEEIMGEWIGPDHK
jgi:hypothetical protein